MPKSKKLNAAARWNLYWVYSDGLEDCFVAARNIRSAIGVEREMNGFDSHEVGATHVCRIPESVAKRQLNIYKKEKISWPWYGWDDLLKRLGAEFRELDGLRETLLDSVVYAQGRRPRVIGSRFITEFKQEKVFSEYGSEEIFTKRQEILFALLGMCVARCQQIEHDIAHSFILAVSAKDKSKHKTINNLIDAWKKKTLGQLIGTIKQSYELEPEFGLAIEWFLEKRNELVHGLTTHPQYDIDTAWGQDEMIAFLCLFEMMSRVIKKAFRACHLSSIDYGNKFLLDPSDQKIKFTRKQQEEMSLFHYFFILRSQPSGAGV